MNPMLFETALKGANGKINKTTAAGRIGTNDLMIISCDRCDSDHKNSESTTIRTEWNSNGAYCENTGHEIKKCHKQYNII